MLMRRALAKALGKSPFDPAVGGHTEAQAFVAVRHINPPDVMDKAIREQAAVWAKEEESGEDDELDVIPALEPSFDDDADSASPWLGMGEVTEEEDG